MAAPYEITFNPNPVQRGFIQSQAKADLFSARMGEGKSTALVWSIFHHTRHNPGAQWALIRDTWDTLESTTMAEFFKWFPPGVCGEYISSRKTFTWRMDGMGGGKVKFIPMDDPQDASKLQSLPLAGFAIDEPAPAADTGGVSQEIFDIGMSRLRQPGINYYCAKLATNNPDEGHWSYKKFVDPGTKDYRVWQTQEPENVKNLPPSYYENLRSIWTDRPDLVDRFVDGKYGYQSKGQKVTKEFNPAIHLTHGLFAVRNKPLILLWDFGLNPTCIITQVSPQGHWNMIHSFVGDGIGVEELIDAEVQPTLRQYYDKFKWMHIGDPAGKTREASSSKNTAVRTIQKKLGGKFKAGEVSISNRVESLRMALRKTVGGTGLVQIDRHECEHVYHALRGGWHYPVSKSGAVGREPAKDKHSHPGDAVSYGASVLFPVNVLYDRAKGLMTPKEPRYFAGGSVRQTEDERPRQDIFTGYRAVGDMGRLK